MAFENAYFIKPDIEFVREFSLSNSAPMFRRRFTLNKTEDARLSVCGLGYAYCYVNGKRVTEDLFTAPVSNYEKTLWYNVYDVSDLLRVGENQIAVICGNGWYNESVETNWGFHKASWRDNPKFILTLSVSGNDVLVSDGEWKCLPHGAVYFNQLRMGEYFDARLYDEKWCELDFCDSSWGFARIDTTPPRGVFRECRCEPIRECRVYTPVRVIDKGFGRYIFDMGQNMSGYARITAVGKCGDELTVRYAECINSEEELEYYGMDSYYCKSGGFQTDRLILSGKRITHSPLFTYHGFRYIEINGLRDIENTRVEGVFVHQAIEKRTEFSTSDEYLNRLFKCAEVSSYSNMFYMLTDCPTREKLGWTNDAQSSTEQILTNFSAERLLEKWHTDIRDAMREDGALPGIVPTAGWGYHWGNGPVSDGVLFEIPYRIYLHTKNATPLKESLPYFERYLSYLESKKNAEGLIEFGLDDWAAPGQIHVTDVEFINSVLLSYFYKVAHIAARLLRRSDADKYLEKERAERELVRKKYVGGDGRCKINEQCAVSMLIYYGIYTDLAPLAKQLRELALGNDYHLRCGMVGMRRLLHALTKCQMTDHAIKLLRSEGYPGYKMWMDQGATSLFEKWDVNVNSDSKNHHMYSDFASWFIKALAGISLNEDKCGEGEFIFDPQPTGELDFVKLNYKSAFGNISVERRWDGTEEIITLKKDKGVRIIYNGRYIQNEINEFRIGEKK